VEVCKMLKLAKAAILGIICLDVHKLLFSPNHPTLANPKNRLDLNMPLSSLLAKKFLHFGWTKRKTLVGENTTLFSCSAVGLLVLKTVYTSVGLVVLCSLHY
jgi:hypothetical protein